MTDTLSAVSSIGTASTKPAVTASSANCSLNDSVTDAESIVIKLQQYRSDIVREVSDFHTHRAQLLQQQRRQFADCLAKERSQLSARLLAMNYAEYVRTYQLPELLKLGVTLPGGIPLDESDRLGVGGRGASKAAGSARGVGAGRGGRAGRGRNAAAAAVAAASGVSRSAKLSIVNPFKFSAEDLARIDPREVQKLRDLYDRLYCLFGNEIDHAGGQS